MTKYLIVATAKASDNTTGRLSVKVDSFPAVKAAMDTLYETAIENGGVILSIYVKNVS